LPWREVVNGPSYVGDLRSHQVDRAGERYTVLALHPSEVPVGGSLIPELFEPVLIGVSPLAFRVRGFERLELPSGCSAVVQEWHIEMP